MKSILPILACLAAVASGSISLAHEPPNAGNPTSNTAPQPGAVTASSDSGEALVGRVMAAVDAHDSISAKVRHRVELMGRPQLIGTGIYLQQGRGAGKSFRLELKLRTTLFATNVEHVCDGNQLWILEDLDGNKDLAVVDIARLGRARPKSRPPLQPRVALLSLAGLPKLLADLQETFAFDRVAESKLDDLRVWSIEGAWNPGTLVQLLPDQKQAIESGGDVDLSALAPNLPHRVVLHVGCDDLFPYRIEYWRIEPEAGDEQGNQQAKLIVVMELYEVRFGATLDASQFVFRGGNLTHRDRTKEFLDQLGLEDPPPEEAKRVLRSQL